jgi:hypothetical protein
MVQTINLQTILYKGLDGLSCAFGGIGVFKDALRHATGIRRA